jgi:LacI family transcriptional regulator
VATAQLDDPGLERLAAEHFPVVLINRRTDSSTLPSVTGDNADGVYLAMRHLVRLGHRHIACLAGPQTTWTGQIRLRAYRQALQDLALPHDENLVVRTESFSESEGARGLAQLLDAKAQFTAVLAGNDLHALGCYDVFRKRGLSCPDDISLVGFNDMPIVDKLSPALTTVHIPQYEIGAEAARLLLDRVNNVGAPVKTVHLSLNLVVRSSTAEPRAQAGGRSRRAAAGRRAG